VLSSQDLQYANEDDYPFQNATIDVADPYEFFFRECTSYIAWRVNQRAGTIDPEYPSFNNTMDSGLCDDEPGCYWGEAAHWYENATSLGLTFDSAPRVGDVAQWVNGCGGSCASGHLAYVEHVGTNGDIVVSEYDFPVIVGGVDHQFNIRAISGDSKYYPEHFIRIPYITLSSSDLNFGEQAVGSSTLLSVAITNPETVAVPVTSVSLSGQTDFSIKSDTCGREIPAGKTCTIEFDFAPEETGMRRALLTLKDIDVIPLVQTISLSGNGK
jgi:surface antigen